MLFTRREFIAGAAAGAAVASALEFPVKSALLNLGTRPRSGVSLAGAEFGCHRPEFSNQNPGICGREYIYPTQNTVAYFAEQGLGLIRLPFRWERLQPRLGQPLDPAEMNHIREVLRWAAELGCQVILDVHNYARYRLVVSGEPRDVVIDELLDGQAIVSRTDFADLWRRIAEQFANNRAIGGFGLMNEPHDLGDSNWKAISQCAVDAIRSIDHEITIYVSGQGWANAHLFEEINGPTAWIHDPADRVAYEAHCYFDAESSGQYRLNYAQELKLDPELLDRGVKRLRVFLDWCRRNKVRGFLGEYGIPGRDAGWQMVLRRTLESLQGTGVGACYWAAGEWWHDYPLSLQPTDDFRHPAPQLAVVKELTGSLR